MKKLIILQLENIKKILGYDGRGNRLQIRIPPQLKKKNKPSTRQDKYIEFTNGESYLSSEHDLVFMLAYILTNTNLTVNDVRIRWINQTKESLK